MDCVVVLVILVLLVNSLCDITRVLHRVFLIMYIKVKVKARMKKEIFEKKSDDHFEISVKEKAERNMANKRVIELIAEHFNITEKDVRIVSGHHHPSKLISVVL